MDAQTELHDLSIIYVLDPPNLTRDSILLLSSIRQILGDVKVIAYVPEEKAAFLFPYVTEFYARMGAEIRLMAPTDRFDPPYKQGNKLLACLQKRETKFTLFLDTDTAIVAPFDRADLVREGGVSVVPEGVQTWGGNAEGDAGAGAAEGGDDAGPWAYVYRKFGLPVPQNRVRLTRSGKMSLPYFNAGMIAFETDSRFAECWLHIATALDADPLIANRRPWLDQIALPAAIAAAGLEARDVGVAWNLTITHPGQPRHLPKFLHDVDAVDAKIVHFHQPKFFAGTRYRAIMDAAIAAHTTYADVDDLTAAGDAQQVRRDEVWSRFIHLKQTQNRTAEQTAEMKALSDEKHAIKAHRDSVTSQALAAPASIVPPLAAQ